VDNEGMYEKIINELQKQCKDEPEIGFLLIKLLAEEADRPRTAQWKASYEKLIRSTRDRLEKANEN